jgi:hypothetical protein
VTGPVIDDDPTVAGLRQRREAGLDGEHGSFEVRGKHGFEVVWTHLGEPRGREDARVRAEDVDAPVALDGLLGHPITLLAIADVSDDRGGLAATGLDVGNDVVQRRGVTTGHENPRACRGEHLGDAAADSPAGPGDNDRATGDRGEHCVSILFVLGCYALR